jgi:hypothetical protein
MPKSLNLEHFQKIFYLKSKLETNLDAVVDYGFHSIKKWRI